MIQVAVVDYNAAENFSLERKLAERGFDATSVVDLMQLVMHLFNKHVDVVVFDMEFSGFGEVLALRKIRSLHKLQSLGIIIMASHFEANHRLELISNGADAFLSKPVEIEELVAYIRNIYRRTSNSQDAVPQAKWHFHRDEWRLVAPSGASLTLSHLEVTLVDMLVKSIGKPVKRKDIIAIGFGLDPLSYDNRRLDSIVSRLRRKLHEAYPLSQPIKVVHSVGYIFTEPVRSD